ncbi:MAG TPA: class I SAM-dependent methyltransferase [Candidatus Methylomirabilis sp.]|nr:class I SAM-dependent methyltransferase [Candidatus Methylomirabilis sp.]
MGRVVEPENAAAFWEARYANALLYGTEPTSVARRLVGLLRAQGVRSILEAGCGSGRDALFYAREGFDVTGTDLSQNALRWAGRRAETEGLRLNLIRDDLARTRLPAGSFDAAIAIHLVHLQPADVRQTMVNQLWRLTRDAGLIVMANYSTSEQGFTTWDAYPEPNTRVDSRGKLVHFFDADDLRALLPPDRFELLTLEEIDLHEVPDSGPVAHREWLSIARKARVC